MLGRTGDRTHLDGMFHLGFQFYAAHHLRHMHAMQCHSLSPPSYMVLSRDVHYRIPAFYRLLLLSIDNSVVFVYARGSWSSMAGANASKSLFIKGRIIKIRVEGHRQRAIETLVGGNTLTWSGVTEGARLVQCLSQPASHQLDSLSRISRLH